MHGQSVCRGVPPVPSSVASMCVMVHDPSGLLVELTAVSMVLVPAASGLPAASES